MFVERYKGAYDDKMNSHLHQECWKSARSHQQWKEDQERVSILHPR